MDLGLTAMLDDEHLATGNVLLSLDDHPAKTAVLNTTELLEAIIIHLPPTSVVTCMRVSRTINLLITTSKAIRRAIVLVPQAFDQGTLSMAQFHSNAFAAFYPRIRSTVQLYPKLPRYDAPDNITLHPLLESSARASFGDNAPGARMVRILDPYKKSSGLSQLDRFGCFSDSLDIWRGPMATWPPVSAIGMRMRRKAPRKDGAQYLAMSERGETVFDCVVYRPDGVRVEDLVDVARILLSQMGIGDVCPTSTCLAGVVLPAKVTRKKYYSRSHCKSPSQLSSSDPLTCTQTGLDKVHELQR